jgi:uncharacterized protein YbaA (DUF1428 family)
MDAYRKWAEKSAAIFKQYGCIEIVESWEDNVPHGKQTDFRRAAGVPHESYFAGLSACSTAAASSSASSFAGRCHLSEVTC